MAPPLRASGGPFLRGLERNLTRLATWAGDPASLAQSAGEQRAAQRFLSSVEGSWDDGDETLVRGYLDRWSPSDDGGAGAARAILEAAAALASLQARPQTLWFFLWEMQSVCAGLAARGAAK